MEIGNVFYSVGEYVEAEEYLQKALTITTEIADKRGEATPWIFHVFIRSPKPCKFCFAASLQEGSSSPSCLVELSIAS